MKPYIFIVILVLVIIAALFFMQYTGSQCNSDEDCIQDKCCHSSQCVPKSDAPNCSDIMCTAECSPNTLDCGQGKCICDKGICKASLN